jgi:hypothetical protein
VLGEGVCLPNDKNHTSSFVMLFQLTTIVLLILVTNSLYSLSTGEEIIVTYL